MEYIPPFSVGLTEQGELDRFSAPHNMSLLVFRQVASIS